MAFAFEDLKVYREALSLTEDIHKLLDSFGRHCPRTIKDQLLRASVSITLNIAEGSGRWHKAEKKQFFWVARGSAFECVALFQIIFRKGLLRDEEHGEYYDRFSELAKMLSGLIRSVEKLSSRSEGINQD